MWGGEVWFYGNEVGVSSCGKRVSVSFFFFFFAVCRQETKNKTEVSASERDSGRPLGTCGVTVALCNMQRWTPAPPRSLGYCIKGQSAGTLVPSCEGRRQAPLGRLVDSRHETGVGSWEGGTRQQEDSAVEVMEGDEARTLDPHGRCWAWKRRFHVSVKSSICIIKIQSLVFYVKSNLAKGSLAWLTGWPSQSLLEDCLQVKALPLQVPKCPTWNL